MIAVSPASLDEALRHLGESPDLRPVAGCTDLLVTDGLGRAGMDRVLDLLSIPELRGIRTLPGDDGGPDGGGPDGGGVEIGATTSFTALRRDPVIRERYPALAQAAAVIGGWQIQNRATLGGNAANASPAGDSLPVLLALNATVRIAGPDGAREIPYDAFHTGYRQTALHPGEIVTAFRLPNPDAPEGHDVQRFRKVGTRQAQAISKVVVALAARVEGGTIRSLRLAAGSVAATPVRLTEAEAEAAGRSLTADTADRIARAAAESVTPIDDVRSTADYRRFVLERVVRRLVLSLREP